MVNIGEVLREIRIQKGLTQKDVADWLRLHRTTYTKYEKSHTPDIDVLIKLSELYDMTIDEMLKIVKPKPSTQVVLGMAEEEEECVQTLSGEELRMLTLFRACKNKNAAITALKRIAADELMLSDLSDLAAED